MTYENPVDFFIPAIIVDIAMRSMASLVNLFRPNIVAGLDDPSSLRYILELEEVNGDVKDK